MIIDSHYMFCSVVKQLYYGALDMGGGVRSCDLCDPYIAVLLNNGTVGVLELKEKDGTGQKEAGSVTLELSWPEIEMVWNGVCYVKLHFLIR